VNFFRLTFAFVLFLGSVSRADEVMPPPPAAYFNDYAGVVSSSTAQQLNQKLEQFERDTSNQIIVAVFPKMQSDSSIEDYTVRVAEAWKVGQKLKNNGAVLFVFIQDRKLYIQVGYGLEGALPDALAKQIIDEEIKPHFKQGDYDAGLTAGVDAIMAATKGEYKGTGSTGRDLQGTAGQDAVLILFLLIVAAVIIGRIYSAYAWASYGSGGRSSGVSWPWFLMGLFAGGGRSGGGGGFSSGGGGGFSGGGFSGGGGSFGGGGAGGSW
jgi:uncharacterized protein